MCDQMVGREDVLFSVVRFSFKFFFFFFFPAFRDLDSQYPKATRASWQLKAMIPGQLLWSDNWERKLGGELRWKRFFIEL